jgi:hypothetical protein
LKIDFDFSSQQVLLSPGLHLIGIALKWHYQGTYQDVQIEEKTPIVNVPKIKLDPVFHLIEMKCFAAAPIDLGEPGVAAVRQCSILEARARSRSPAHLAWSPDK